MNYITKETLTNYDRLEGKIVSATCANTNARICGRVIRVRECVDHYQNGGVRYLCDIENAGYVRVAYASTVEIGA
jgi:hypothetical protein